VRAGIFAPLLVLGALIGLAVGQVAKLIVPTANVSPAVFAVVGMAAYFTAIVRAPLTGVALIIEMTGNYEQMLPLLISCFFSYAVAEYLNDLTIYEVLLERDLLNDGDHANLTQPVVMDFTIQEGSPFVHSDCQLGVSLYVARMDGVNGFPRQPHVLKPTCVSLP
jgi:CIC family chloride channel protein